MGTLGTAAAGARGGDVESTDVVEFVAVDERCPHQRVCNAVIPGNAGLFVTREGTPRCMRLPGFAVLTDNTSFVVQPAQAVTPSGTLCDSSPGLTNNGNLQLGVLDLAFRPPARPLVAADLAATFLYPGRVVRYRIGPGLDTADPALPALWRSDTGRYDATGGVVPEPGEGGFPGANSPWELVARGIEDLQIEYRDGTGVWQNQPPLVTANAWNTLVREVRITLSARASAANLAGQTTGGGGAPPAVRGQLSTTVTPRAAFNELQMGSQIQ
jgi:hypothetical protein